MARLHLPKKDEHLAETLLAALDRGRTYRNPLAIEWKINYGYLLGVRRFSLINFQTGQVQMNFETSEGRLNMRYEDVLVKLQREIGRLSKMNTLPLTKPRTIDLDGNRRSAVGQVTLDNLVQEGNPEELKKDLVETLVMYGTVGLATWADNDLGSMVGCTMETVPPWQIVPVPARPSRASDTRGIIRHRYLPLRWLRENRPELKLPRNDRDERLEITWVPLGGRIQNPDETTEVTSDSATSIRDSMASMMGVSSSGQGDKLDEPFVQILELWVPDGRNRVETYVCQVGKLIVKRADFTEWEHKDRPFVPIKMCRYHHTAGFWGRSFVSPLIPLNIEVEMMLQNLFKNVQDLDNFGITLVPGMSGVKHEHLKSTKRPKVVFYEPDPAMPGGIHIERIMPVNSGDAPGRTAALGNQLLDRLSRESPMYSGKAAGRLDSASGHGLLYETSGIPTIPVEMSIEAAYAQNYKVLLKKASTLLGGQSSLALTTIDDNIAGVVLNPQTGKMELGEHNPIPDPDDIIVTIREMSPHPLSQDKQDLVGLRDRGLIQDEDFYWINYKKNLGLPVDGLAGQTIVESIKSCMYRNIVQWNDGVTPVGVAVSTFDAHSTHLNTIQAFMNRPIFALGSEAVRDAFEARRKFHESALGGYPDEMPMPEDALEAQEAPYGTESPEQLPQGLQQMMAQAQAQGPGAGPGGR